MISRNRGLTSSGNRSWSGSGDKINREACTASVVSGRIHPPCDREQHDSASSRSERCGKQVNGVCPDGVIGGNRPRNEVFRYPIQGNEANRSVRGSFRLHRALEPCLDTAIPILRSPVVRRTDHAMSVQITHGPDRVTWRRSHRSGGISAFFTAWIGACWPETRIPLHVRRRSMSALKDVRP